VEAAADVGSGGAVGGEQDEILIVKMRMSKPEIRMKSE
jgi:hypothetical protein